MALLAGVLMWVAFRGVDLQRLMLEIRSARPFWILLSIVFSVVAFLSRAYRWKLLIDPLGYNTSLRKSTYSLMTGYLANLVFPRLGEVTRCATLSKSNKIPFDQLIGTVILERVLDFLCLLIIIFITAVVEAQRLSDFFLSNILDPVSAKISGIASSPVFWIVLVLVITAVILFVRARRKSGAHAALFIRINDLVTGVIKGLKSIRTVQKPWQFIFHTILIWVLYYYTAYVCFFALDSTSDLSWKVALLVLVAGGLGMSVPVQGGFGAYHLLVMEGLALYGIDRDHGRAFATLVHSTQVILVILMGGLSLILLVPSKEISTDENPGTDTVKNT
jgi:glycosyltransferase 2 family protein